MKKPDIIIAIDPDVEKSGVAELRPQTRIMETSSLTFPLLLDYLQFMKSGSTTGGMNLLVVVEAGWLIQSNWHLKSKDSKAIAAAKGNAAGRNHEVGRKIVEMCQHYGMEVIEQLPLKKCWRGPDGKITHNELVYFTKLKGRTNQEERDAALIAWNYANLPIKVPPRG